MKRAILILSTFVFATAAAAQTQTPPQCSGSDTFESCWQKFNPATTVAATAAAVQAELSTTNTGVPGITQPNASSMRDFLSLFTAAVDTATVSETEGAVTLDWNVPFGYFSTGDTLKLQTILAQPELSQQVTTALASNPAAVTALTDSLDASENVSFSASFAPLSQRFGRSLAPHVGFMDAMVNAAIGTSEKSLLQAEATLAGQLAGQTDASGAPIDFATTPLSAYPASLRATIVNTVEQLASRESGIATIHQEVVNAFTALLNNQPQPYFSGIYNARGELVGPNTWSAKLTYEMGSRNLNKFYRDNPDCKRVTAASADMSASCLDKLRSFAQPLTGSNPAGASNRLAVSAEYQASQTNDISVPEYSLTLNNPATHSFVYSVTYGIPLATTIPSREGRIDIALNYENVSNDPTRQDRFIGSITYSQKVTDTFTFPISLVYANHGKYLTDVDRRMGVHFGISYKLPDTTP
jgi:hypothetical protein